MKRKFIVEVELPEDPENILNAGMIQSVVDSFYNDYEDVRYYPVLVEAKELSDNVHFVTLSDEEHLRWGVMTPDEIRKRME